MDQALWALGRGTGVTALVFLSLAVALGIATRSGRPLWSMPRFGVTEIHRTTALFATALVAIHVVTLLIDPYAQLRLVDAVVPFLGAYRPFWLGLGTLAVDVLLAVMITSLLRHRLGLRVFRLVHWATYGLWPLALFHALGNGTDHTRGWFRVIAGFGILLVAAAGIWRAHAEFIEYHRVRTAERR